MRSRWRATSSLSPGSQIGMRPSRNPVTFASSMSMHQTSLPSSANPAAVTRPTYPVPITAIGSRCALMTGDPAYLLLQARQRGRDPDQLRVGQLVRERVRDPVDRPAGLPGDEPQVMPVVV